MTRDKILSLLKTNRERILLTIVCEAVSTNDIVYEMQSDGNVCIAIAERQSGGRGRLGRSFSSPEGGLYISFKKLISGDMEDIFPVMPLAALCVCDTIDALYGVTCEIKWPNDVLIDGKKVCGILAQAHMDNKARYLILGIGINFNSALPSELENAASLKDITGYDTDLDLAAAMVIDSVVGLLSNAFEENTAFMERYREKCMNIGKRVTVTYGGSQITGIVTDITDYGGMTVMTDSGKSVTVTSGEATLKA